jgi:hypothetical protein
MKFMRQHVNDGCVAGRAPRNIGEPLGYTVSRTPPDENVEFIQEDQTICMGVGPLFLHILSEGRSIPRRDVTYRQYTFFVTDHPGYDGCENYDFTVPPSALPQ